MKRVSLVVTMVTPNEMFESYTKRVALISAEDVFVDSVCFCDRAVSILRLEDLQPRSPRGLVVS